MDISIEYNCTHEEFIGENVEKISNSPMWVSYHTDFGKDYLSCWPIMIGELHQRILIDNLLAKQIMQDKTKYQDRYVNKSFGGFYTEIK